MSHTQPIVATGIITQFRTTHTPPLMTVNFPYYNGTSPEFLTTPVMQENTGATIYPNHGNNAFWVVAAE
jgi:hypothetical protein